MKVARKLLVALLVLASVAITVAQQGDRSPSFHDPAGTAIFPQFIVGRVGSFIFDIEQRIGNGGDLPFSGRAVVLNGDLSSPVGLVVNGAPYNPAGIPINLGPKESLSLNFTQEPVPPPTPGLMGSCEEEECGDKGGEALEQCLCDECDYTCVTIDGALVAEENGSAPAGGQASVSDLSHSFFYNLRDQEGNLIDSVAVPEGRAGTGIRFVMARRPGFDTGVAVFVTVPQPVGIRVFLPDGGPSPAGTTVLEGVNPLQSFRDDFFLNEFIQNLPDVIDSAVVEMTVENGEIYGMALGVKVEGSNVQLSGQNVNPFGLDGGTPFDR